ncbi:M48 family metallopeptidase [Aromatoleum toluclasticum]|uniref:M48 family metallopeptidase n=1 Tax=Aromatoleum toluclasticum TaxID=92003 RepID=UPI00037A705C|nr:M48 family metallopeptidase [Aromatoleum toluclasticum]MCC4117380.1 M48 family metallopeptidase [Aromatoleum toluclasticum]
MRLEGRFFDGASSRSHRASVLVEDGCARVEGASGDALLPAVELERLEFSSRVGNTPRFLRFPGGGSFETDDNDAVDRLSAPSSSVGGFAHRLESKLRYVLIGLLVAVAFVWGSVQWGVPALARIAAFSLPAEVTGHAERMALEIMDRQLFEPSRLPQEEQARLLAVFAPLTEDAAQDPPVRVLFRAAAGPLGANALALPAGTVVLTDPLVQLAQHDEELVGVLAHEIGHIRHRHAMRSSLQASFVGLVATLVVGDVSSVSSIVTALPLILTQLGYSRAFEREADQYAVETLRRHGIGTQPFVDILQRLDPSGDEKGAYLSTHPPTPERVRRILSGAKGLTP